MGVLPDINEMSDSQFRMWTAKMLIDMTNEIKALRSANKIASFIGGFFGGATAYVSAFFGSKITGV